MNKIFVFGQTGVGKSTLCAAITYFFHIKKGYIPRVDLENKDGLRQIRNWVKCLRNRNFPDKTLRGTFLLVNVGFYNVISHNQMGLTFIEVAGEDLRMLDPLDPEYENRPKILDSLLMECDSVILVASVEPLDENDRYLHQYFLEYLGKLNIKRPICLVLSEWDKLKEKSNFPVKFAEQQYGEALKLLSRFDSPEVICFSIGRVNDEGKIEEIDFSQGTEDIVNWINDITVDTK